MSLQVTEDDIETFEREFRGSQEEAGEVLRYYLQFQGDMDKAFEWIMCSYPKRDSHRFMDLVEAAIKEGRVKAFKRYRAWAKRVAAARRPADPLAPPKRSKKQKESEQALVSLIRGRQKSALAGTLDAIAAKYGGAGEAEPVAPTEEEFQQAAQRLGQRSAAGKAKVPAAVAAAKGGSRKKAKAT